MARKRHGAEEIIGKLREVEVLLAKGRSVADAAKAIGGKRGFGAVLSVRVLSVVVGPGAGGFGLTLWIALTTTRRAAVIGGLRF